MHNITPFVWQGSISHELTKIISYIKSRILISMSYESCFSYICGTGMESFFLDSVPIVHDFLDVVPTNIPGLPPQSNVDFVIHLKL